MNQTNKATRSGNAAALHEAERSELQAVVGGQFVTAANAQPLAAYPVPDPWLAAQPRLSVPVSAMPWPTPWVVAGPQ